MVASRKQSVFFSICSVNSLRTHVLTPRKANGDWVSCTGYILPEIVRASNTGFRQRCKQRLEELAEAALGSQNYTKAAEHFSTLLLLDTEDRVDVLIKRSRARAMMELWEDALRDADEVYPVSSHHEDYS